MKTIIIDGIEYNLTPTKSTPIFKIGDEYLNGIVAYVDESGQHGFVCAKSDYFEKLSWKDAIKVFKDTPWKLPTKYELDILYKNKDMLGGFATYFYWSSSETNFYNAWFQDFTNGFQYYYYENSTYSVRAVRAF